MSPEEELEALRLKAKAGAAAGAPSASADPSSGDAPGLISRLGTDFYNGAIGQNLQGAASTLKNVFGANDAASAVQSIAPAEKDGPVTTPIISQDGSVNWSGLPDVAAEQTGGYLSNRVLAGVGGTVGGLAGSLIGPEGTVGGATLGAMALPAAVGWLTGAGAETAARATANGHDAPTMSDKIVGSAVAAGDGALNALPFLGRGSAVSRIAKNTAVGGVESAANQVGASAGTETGLNVNPYEVANGALTGTVGAVGGEGASKLGKAVVDLPNLPAKIRYDADNGDGSGHFDEDDVELANRFRTLSNGDNQLGNVANTSSETSAQGLSKAVLMSLRSEAKGLAADLQNQAKTPSMQARIRSLDTDLDALRPDSNPEGHTLSRLITEIPIKQSGNMKSAVSTAHIDAIKQGFGAENPTANRLVSVLRQIQKVTPFTEPRGDLGGLSKYTRLIDPTDSRSAINKLSIGMRLTPVGVGTAALRFLGGAAINRGIARNIDKLTNNRSLPKRYVESVERSIARGDTSPISNADRVAKLRADQAIQQAKADAAKQQLDAQNRAEADRQAQQAARSSNDPKLTGHTNNDSVGENGPQPSVADLATRPMFETNRVPSDKYFEPYKLWENETGLGPKDTFDALSKMEQAGQIPEGSANRYRYSIRSFPTSGDGADITYNLQQAVKNGFNPGHDSNSAKIAYAAQQAKMAQSGQPAYKQASQNRAQSKYTNQISDEAQRRFNNLTTEIEAQREPLDARAYSALHHLARSINSAGMDRDARQALVDKTLGLHFGTPVEQAHWQKAFAPLVAIGNDFVIAKKADADSAKEDAFRDHTNDLYAKAENYKATAANDDEAPTKKPKNMRDILKVIQGGKTDDAGDSPISEPPEPPTKPDGGSGGATFDKDGQGSLDLRDTPNEPKSRADKALSKLNKKSTQDDKQGSFDFNKEAQEDADKSGAVSEQDQSEPKSPLNGSKAEASPKQGKRSLADQLDERVAKTAMAKQIATEDADLLSERIAQLGHGNEGKLEQVIYENARDDISANTLIDGFARKFGVPPEAAAHIVLQTLRKWQERGDVELVVPSGRNALMLEDGAPIRDEEGNQATTLLVRPKREDLVKNIEIAKSISMTNKLVNQEGPKAHYSVDQLHDGANSALKDIPDNEVTGEHAPLIDFVDALRSSPMGIHPAILDQIEKAASNGGAGVHSATIRDQLTPTTDYRITKSGRKVAITDKSPLYSVGQLLYQLGQGGKRLSHQFFQEWTAGANGRVYSRNGSAHTQSGDLMKGIIRAPKKDTLGGMDGFNWMLHSFGNLLGVDKESPATRRARIFEPGTIPALLEFAKDPFGRTTFSTSTGKDKPIAKIVKDGEGFFQVLAVAHEVNDMVAFAAARFPKLAKNPEVLLKSPEVQADLAKNYKTDWLVQLDGNNNAYQIAGLLLGDPKILQATAMQPKPGSVNPDQEKGGDIYLEPAFSVADRIPELKALREDPDHPLPDSKLRKLFKKPIGTYLYAAAYKSRRAAFEDALKDIAGKGVPVFSVNGSPGLIKVPDEIVNNMLSPEGHTFTFDKYEGDGVKQVARRVRIVKAQVKATGKDGSPSTRTVFKIAKDDSVRGGRFKTSGRGFDTLEDAVQSAYGSDFYGRLNRELVHDFESRYPSIRQYLNFADKVASIVKDRAAQPGSNGDDRVTVRTPDGIPLKYSFKDVSTYGTAPFDVGGNTFNIGFRLPSEKSRGRGLAAFMTHAMDAYALRESYKRLGGSMGLKAFNPIHDSYGFHPSDATRGQQTVLKTIQEFGSSDYNHFLRILQDNNIDPADFVRQGGVIPDRQNVEPQDAAKIPTALS